MAVMDTYHASVERDGRFWLIRIREIDRSTQARHLREVDAMARDLIAVMRDVEPDSFELVVSHRLPDSVHAHLARAEKLRVESDLAKSRAAEESRAAVRELVDAGLPLRDIGQLLGISHQRAAQLAADTEPKAS
ncbi:hypothetical protein GCM10023317_61930 [Actinopolymorpha pittospori]